MQRVDRSAIGNGQAGCVYGSLVPSAAAKNFQGGKGAGKSAAPHICHAYTLLTHMDAPNTHSLANVHTTRGARKCRQCPAATHGTARRMPFILLLDAGFIFDILSEFCLLLQTNALGSL